MCKALDKGIIIRDLMLDSKTGGKSGDFKRAKKKRTGSRK
jgi:cyclic pyranopterin phosphate synthase